MADVAETPAASPLNEMYAESLRSSEQDATLAGGACEGGPPPARMTTRASELRDVALQKYV